MTLAKANTALYLAWINNGLVAVGIIFPELRPKGLNPGGVVQAFPLSFSG